MIAKVRSKWINGDLVFYDSSGTEIARFDSSNSALDIKTAYLNGVELTATAAELNKLDGAGTTVVSGTQAEVIADPSGGTTTDAEARTAINSIIDVLQAFDIVASE